MGRGRVVKLCLWFVLAPALGTQAAILPDGFQETVAIEGLTQPTAVRFAPDGRIFVAEKSGVLKVFDGLGDPLPDVLTDLGTNVHDFWDRGLLGLAVDSEFPIQPYLYVFYTIDTGAPGGPWGDACPTPPGPTTDGCVVDGRISRLEVAADNTLVGTETVLLESRWCQQFPTHSVGDLLFDADKRVLYAGAGDGASFGYVDYGQAGGSSGSPTPSNPCGDPPVGTGGTQTPPTAEGGALRSQDLRTPGDPVSYDGTLIALDPGTGAPAPNNPLLGGDPGDDHIIAYGLRNPYRIALRPGTEELWTIDVGWKGWEEINRVFDVDDAVVENFGWPCYEGAASQPGYFAQALTICQNLYADSGNPATPPYYAYEHWAPIDDGLGEFECSKFQGSTAITGLAFNAGGVYPASYQNALFFSDFRRQCVFVIEAGPDGLPDTGTAKTFIDAASDPIDLRFGPDGRLYYVNYTGGQVIRIDYSPTNLPPVAVAAADPSDGPVGLMVQFDAAGSTDPNAGDVLTYAWDLDADGQFDDSTLLQPSYQYLTQGQYPVGLRVTDDSAELDTDIVLITVGNTSPTPSIVLPHPSVTWRVGQEISFEGQAVDPEDGPLAESSLDWDIVVQQCTGGTPDDCLAHSVQENLGTAAGTFVAPDQPWYSFLQIKLTATDSGFPGGGGGGLAGEAVLELQPEEVDLTFNADPPGLQLAAGNEVESTPFTRTAVVGSANTVGAPTPQDHLGGQYTLVSWSDGGAAGHEIVAPENDTGYVATYAYAGISTDWWDADWGWRSPIAFDNSLRTVDLTDFPVLIVLDGTRIDYDRVGPQGQDLRFVDADATTVLAHEIESWQAGGTSYVWVKVPKIDAGSSTDFIWIYYDNPGVLDAQNPTAVWSGNFAGVWHLHEDVLDSAPFGNHGTNFGSVNSAGAIGDAQLFDGNDSIKLTNDASLGLETSLSLEAWIRILDPNHDGSMPMVSKKTALFGTSGYHLGYDPLANLGLILATDAEGGQAANVDLDVEWHYVVGTIQGTACRFYVDGVDRTTDSVCEILVNNGFELYIGRTSGGSDYFSGRIDEVRVSSIIRSAEWIVAQYQSMTDGLATLGAPQNNCGPALALTSGLAVHRSSLSWSPVPTATGYDVVRGTLSNLDQGFSQSVEQCLADDLAFLSLDEDSDPPTGQGFWFLVRAVSCVGSGSYASGGIGEQGPRDAGIDSALAACP